ncbi:MAG: FAD-dependent oxidoreductase [Treponemataceae bacterium]
MKRIENLKALEKAAAAGRAKLLPPMTRICVGMGTCGIGNGADLLFAALEKALAKSGAASVGSGTVMLKKVGCFGFCAAEPLVTLAVPGRPILLFTEATAKDANAFVEAARDAKALEKIAGRAAGKIDTWDFKTAEISFYNHASNPRASGGVVSDNSFPMVRPWNEIPFFKGQEKVVLRNAGLIDPEDIEEFLAVGGYSSLAKAVFGMKPSEVIDEVEKSGLRGRGGAGFPTARKWRLLAGRPETAKWIVCNADEGDPGAYMNRNEIESDPFSLLEGITLGAYATGASQGFVYIRAEYPLAVERLRKAVETARAYGFLGDHILGTDFSFDIDLVRGAGAFVCGEETALTASAEGLAGRPVPRPPFPAEKGFRAQPTNINNVETWFNIPVILAKGGEWFSRIGTPKSAGTKVFSLVGKVKNTGLVELPLGTKLERMVYEMGGGAGAHKRIRAVQSGGPSGGCIPADKFDASIDYESLASLGAIMGSGGMVVMDQDNCMVDVARYFVSFTAAESCGKCAPCREGLSQMLRILGDVSRGEASYADLDELERIARVVKDSALCGLGQTSANPVLTTLKYFREEYERHIRDKRCDAGTCENLFQALCENSCPLHMNIPGYLALVKEGRLEDAYELTVRDNPLPGTLGRICHFHCSTRCRRETLDDPVQQGEIHRYLADTMRQTGRDAAVWKRLAEEKKRPTGKRIAIVGAGPAGLGAAFYLSRLGHEVTVYDAQEKAGGILRYGIPAYRLPKEVLDHELGVFAKLGVRFTFNTRIGVDFSLGDLAKANDAVLMAIGAEADKPLGIAGENLPGVHPGYEYLDLFARKKAPKLGNRILVIGGGNVAVDAARTLFRLGKDVTVAYRRTRSDMPANLHELEGAEAEGVAFRYLLAPKEAISGKNGHVSMVRFEAMGAGPVDRSGRPTPVPTGKIVELPCDDVLVAVGERVDSAAFAREGVAVGKDGRINADPFTQRIGMPNVWATGDAVTGPATAAEAMGEAKRVAKEIDKALTGEDRFASLFKDFGYGQEIPPEPEGSRKNRPRHLPPDQRLRNFIEINQGYDGDQAISEARRCLRCDVRPNARSPWR